MGIYVHGNKYLCQKLSFQIKIIWLSGKQVTSGGLSQMFQFKYDKRATSGVYPCHPRLKWAIVTHPIWSSDTLWLRQQQQQKVDAS